MTHLDPNAVAIVFAGILMLMYTRNVWNHRGYSCPSCGTTKKDEHHPTCQWKKFYEDD